jgi:hypothetical protein
MNAAAISIFKPAVRLSHQGTLARRYSIKPVGYLLFVSKERRKYKINSASGTWSRVQQKASSDLQLASALSTEELENRRWQLVQKSWDRELTPTERLGLRFIEARLDAQDIVENASLLAERSSLRERQERILSSLEHAISQLRK